MYYSEVQAFSKRPKLTIKSNKLTLPVQFLFSPVKPDLQKQEKRILSPFLLFSQIALGTSQYGSAFIHSVSAVSKECQAKIKTVYSPQLKPVTW